MYYDYTDLIWPVNVFFRPAKVRFNQKLLQVVSTLDWEMMASAMPMVSRA